MDLPESDRLKLDHAIVPASGSLNGYHTMGGLSRYNEQRTGFIFENEVCTMRRTVAYPTEEVNQYHVSNREKVCFIF